MSLKIARVFETFRANVTLEWPLVCVNNKMLLERVGLVETLRANVAVERSFPV